jgi:hypothetical protein
MEAMAYAFDRADLPEFPRLLHLLMQDVDGKALSRKEMAARLTKAGFEASDSNVSQWLNKQRTPPPGLPYYSSLALDLDEEQSRNLAWSYTRTYKDKRKRVQKKKKAKRDVPQDSVLTEENVERIADKREKYETNIEKKRREKERGGSSRKPGNRGR